MKRIYTILFLITLLNTSFVSQNYQLSAICTHPDKNAELTEYEGSYSFLGDTPVRKFVVSVKENELYGQADSYEANKLLKQPEDDTFLSTSSYGSTIVFTRDTKTKKVTGLQLTIQGTTLEASLDK